MFRQTVSLVLAIFMLGIISNGQDIPFGELCKKSEQCYGYPETSDCDPILGICNCKKDHIITPGDEDVPIRCEPIRNEIRESCRGNFQCTYGKPGPLSECVPSYDDPTRRICNCTVHAVYEPDEHICYKKRNKIGDKCEVDIQCTVNLGDLSSCMSQNCSCSSEGVGNKNGTFCLPIVNVIGGSCEERQQCSMGALGNYSDCVDSIDDSKMKFCDCIAGEKPEPEQNVCVIPNGYIGESCKSDGDCVGKPGISSACDNSGKCLCLGGYLPSGQMDDCLAVANGLGENCVESGQCQRGIPGNNSACVFGSCRCTNSSINEPGKHYCHTKAILVGDPCQVHEQCWPSLSDKSYCIGGKCECTKESKPSVDLLECV